MATSFALDDNFDIVVKAGGGIESTSDRATRIRNNLRVILKTVLATVPLHPDLGLPLEPMIRSRSTAFIEGAVERAMLEQEPEVLTVEFPHSEIDASIGQVSLDVRVKLRSGETVAVSL